jgi:MFS family permease
MKRRQLALLFSSNLIFLSIGTGLSTLLPVYAVRLGAAPDKVGVFMSLAFLGLAAGTFFAGWVSDKFQRRRMFFIVFSALDCVALWLMGRMPTFEHLAVVLVFDWFVGGVALTLLSILAGLFAEPSERGRVFGTLSLTGGLCALCGLWAGIVADWQGYRMIFTVAALGSVFNPIIGFFLEDKVVVRDKLKDGAHAARWVGLGGSFVLLLVGKLMTTVAQNLGILSRALTMEALDFAALAISSVAAFGGAVSLGLSFLVGRLSDRFGRKWPLAFCYLSGAAGLVVLTMAKSLPHFWLVAVLFSFIGNIASGIGSALVVDLVPPESMGKGLAWFSAVGWIGAIIGYAGTGYAVQNFGVVPTLLTGALLPLVAIVSLVPIRQVATGEQCERRE